MRKSESRRLLSAVAPILLSLVAVHQVYLACTSPLTSWKGGGFGMFAEIYGRFVKTWEYTATTQQAFRPTDATSARAIHAARALPTRSLASAAAETVQRQNVDDANRWVVLGVYDLEFATKPNCQVLARELHYVKTERGLRLDGRRR